MAINLSQDENEKVEKALEYTVLNWNSLVRVLLQNSLEEFDKKEEFTFVFEKKSKNEKSKYKTRMVRLDEQGYKKMADICACTPFTMSNLAKYFIMPQMNKIIEKKGLDYKP